MVYTGSYLLVFMPLCRLDSFLMNRIYPKVMGCYFWGYVTKRLWLLSYSSCDIANCPVKRPIWQESNGSIQELEKTKSLPIVLWGSSEADLSESRLEVDSSPGWHLNCSLVRDLEEYRSCTQIPETLKPWDSVCCFKPIHFGAICYTAIDN